MPRGPGVVDPVDPKVFGSRIMSVILGLITWQARICLLVLDFFLPGFGELQVKAHFWGVQKKGGAFVLLEVEALNSCSCCVFFLSLHLGVFF